MSNGHKLSFDMPHLYYEQILNFTKNRVKGSYIGFWVNKGLMTLNMNSHSHKLSFGMPYFNFEQNLKITKNRPKGRTWVKGPYIGFWVNMNHLMSLNMNSYGLKLSFDMSHFNFEQNQQITKNRVKGPYIGFWANKESMITLYAFL